MWMGGPPAWASVLVRPEMPPKIDPVQRGHPDTSGLRPDSASTAKTIASTPIVPAISDGAARSITHAPNATPNSAPGRAKKMADRSMSLRCAVTLITSVASNNGSNTPNAMSGGRPSDMTGRATAVPTPPNPALEMPRIATAQRIKSMSMFTDYR